MIPSTAGYRQLDPHTLLAGNITTTLENSLAASHKVNACHQTNNFPARCLPLKREHIVYRESYAHKDQQQTGNSPNVLEQVDGWTDKLSYGQSVEYYPALANYGHTTISKTC